MHGLLQAFLKCGSARGSHCTVELRLANLGAAVLENIVGAGFLLFVRLLAPKPLDRRIREVLAYDELRIAIDKSIALPVAHPRLAT
jgi:hypothetical protein